MKNRKVQTWVRIRPTAKFAHDMIDLQSDNKSINVHGKRDPRHGVVNNQILDWSFKLDGIFHNTPQDVIYQQVMSPIVTKALDGYNGTVLCYGQTGAGKTFTITGATENYRHRGMIPRAIQQVFSEIEERPEHAISIRISYLEIYNETMIDLLSSLPEAAASGSGGQEQITPMTVVEDQNGVYVKGLSCHLAQSEEEALNLLFEGETNRAIAEHSLNKHSSRSHCIFTVYIEARSRVSSEAKYTLSKLNFVDLAGSERIGKTNSKGTTQTEAMYINKSLSFLEQTVIALADKRREHVPFRQTKLTHCLKDSIGGVCNTLLIANIWGEAEQLEETVSTLRFATRMMCVASEPALNEHYDPAVMVRKLEQEIAYLKYELAMHDTLNNRSQVSYEPLSEQQRYEIKQQVRGYLDNSLDELDIVNIRQIHGVFDTFKVIYTQMKQEMETEFRARYTLVDKTDPAAIAAAQEAGLPIDDQGELVGDTDGSSFGFGKAPSSAKAGHSSVVNARKRDAKRKGKDMTRGAGSPGPKAVSPGGTSMKAGAAEAKAETPSKEQTDREQAATPSTGPAADDGKKSGKDSRKGTVHDQKSSKKKRDKGSTNKEHVPSPEQTPTPTPDERPSPPSPRRPDTPPPRSEAFEEFKREEGSEINRILTENKDILAQKKATYANVAKTINETKARIDASRRQLDAMKRDREAMGAIYNEDGDVIISEDEFLEINKLKSLKAQYRASYEELKTLKTEVQYCQKLVDQCRQRLVQEFDKHYSESFLAGGESDGVTSAAAGVGVRAGVLPPQRPDAVLEDEQEKFDRLQMELLMENPDSSAFYNAKLRTQRRKTLDVAVSQAQPGLALGRRTPGQPVRSLRAHPPNMLHIY